MDEKFNRMPVSVIHLDKDGTVIDVEDYNLDKVEPDLWAIKGLAASLLPVIREFYTHEENVQAFEAWLKERETQQAEISAKTEIGDERLFIPRFFKACFIDTQGHLGVSGRI